MCGVAHYAYPVGAVTYPVDLSSMVSRGFARRYGRREESMPASGRRTVAMSRRPPRTVGVPRVGIAIVEGTFVMKFIVQWKGEPAMQQAAIERFMKTGGQPPDNVKMLGRWHAGGEFRGVAIVEATDASAVAAMVMQWGDIFSFTTTPALTDEELGAVLAAQQRSAN